MGSACTHTVRVLDPISATPSARPQELDGSVESDDSLSLVESTYSERGAAHRTGPPAATCAPVRPTPAGLEDSAAIVPLDSVDILSITDSDLTVDTLTELDSAMVSYNSHSGSQPLPRFRPPPPTAAKPHAVTNFFPPMKKAVPLGAAFPTPANNGRPPLIPKPRTGGPLHFASPANYDTSEWQQLPSLVPPRKTVASVPDNTSKRSSSSSTVFELAPPPPPAKNKEMLSYLLSVSSQNKTSSSSGFISDSATVSSDRTSSTGVPTRATTQQSLVVKL